MWAGLKAYVILSLVNLSLTLGVGADFAQEAIEIPSGASLCTVTLDDDAYFVSVAVNLNTDHEGAAGNVLKYIGISCESFYPESLKASKCQS